MYKAKPLSMDSQAFAADTHTGLRHHNNEDTCYADPEAGLWLIADGVGGQPDGEVASAIVRDTIAHCIAQNSTLEEAVRSSHEAILNAVAEGKGAAGMGSTVVAALLRRQQLDVCWVGDSRAYLWDRALTLLTADHNRVAELLAQQAIDATAARDHPERNVLTQALGVSPQVDLEPGLYRGELQPGQQLLLCSDGLSDELPDSLIAHLLSQHATPRAQVDALISAALDAGGRDNISAVIVGSSANSDKGHQPHGSARRSASGGKPNDGKFPLRALLFTAALVIAAVLWIT
ncbi:MAG: protein phosphatase 2C domain-containing protein [Gammaproteobacteria bacterium]|nr:protein phosphatase 2C domain-containing protein [Gammaproteobacteria bacterium]